MLFALLVACGGNLKFETTEDIRYACEEYTPEDIELSVTFDALNEGCPFGEGENLPAEEGIYTARIEQSSALNIPEGGVICDLQFDFAGVSGGQGQAMEYDDNFLLALNGAVLATSDAALVESLSTNDDLSLYDWGIVAGTPMSFQDVSTWCLGEATGESECTIPPPETAGTLALSFDGDLVDQLALRAIEASSYDFSFVSFGDNDDTDCSHETFTFTVVAPVVLP